MTKSEDLIQTDFLVDRRTILTGGSVLGLAASLGSMSALAQQPKKGGTLRLGMEGGSASDSLDPRTYADSIPICYSLMIWNTLVEIGSDATPIPELAESWESAPGAKEWIFNLRKGVTFGSGKTFDADDMIYSLNLHRGETKSPAKALLEPITDLIKMSPSQVKVVMKTGNADLPAIFSDYHLIMVPNGTTDFRKADGTAAFTLEEWQPGVRIVCKRKPGEYWKKGRGHVDAVELRYILESAARTQALVTGQVDAVNRLDPKTIGLLSKNKNIRVVRTPGTGNRYAFVARVDAAPYNNRDLMLAVKYGVDRKKIIKNVYAGYASLGNDHTVAASQKYYDKNQVQRTYDPDKAKFHLKKSGYSGDVELLVSEGAYSGATDAAVLFQESAKRAGMNVDVKRVSGDGYWDNVWLKVPFCAVYWGPRPTMDLQLSQTYLSTASWNDSAYKNPRFDDLVIKARVELDEKKRAAMYAECQHLLSEEAGMVCFMISDYLDGVSAKLQGVNPHARYDLDDLRVPEKAWFV